MYPLSLIFNGCTPKTVVTILGVEIKIKQNKITENTNKIEYQNT